MSYYESLKDLILSLKKDVLFLSPRERWFLKILEQQGYSLEAVKKGIERFYKALRPDRRSTTPVFLSFHYIEKIQKELDRKKLKDQKTSWREKFHKNIEKVRDFLKSPIQEPSTEEEAYRILQKIENEIVQNLWDSMPQDEKKAILRKYAQFKADQELLKLLVKSEIMDRYRIPKISIL